MVRTQNHHPGGLPKPLKHASLAAENDKDVQQAVFLYVWTSPKTARFMYHKWTYFVTEDRRKLW